MNWTHEEKFLLMLGFHLGLVAKETTPNEDWDRTGTSLFLADNVISQDTLEFMEVITTFKNIYSEYVSARAEFDKIHSKETNESS